MKIDKAAVLAKIDEHYEREAQAEHERQVSEQRMWNRWHLQQTDRTPALIAAIRDIEVRLGKGEFLSAHDLHDALDKLAHDYARPQGMKTRGSYYFTAKRPEVETYESILERMKDRGRFKGLQDVLQAAVGDTIAVSMLKDMGVLSTEDARLLFATQVK